MESSKRNAGKKKRLPNGKYSSYDIELVPMEIEFLLHPGDVGIVHIGAVELEQVLVSTNMYVRWERERTYIIQEITQTAKSQDKEINLAQKNRFPRPSFRASEVVEE